MGIWDMLGLMQQYKKYLVLADNPAFDEATRAEFGVKAEEIREQMARYMERVEKQQEVRESLE